MMTRARFRQTARLERLAEAYLRPKEQADSRIEEMVRDHAFRHTANLSALILYGGPKIDEPLSIAWRRCWESAEWPQPEKFDDVYGERDSPFGFGAARVANLFRKNLLPGLAGGDEAEKFGLIFRKAPPWLLWFTYGDLNAEILGIKVPDLSTVHRFVRDPRNFMNDYLPPGPFECRLRAHGREDELTIIKDWMIRKNRENEADGVTPRERKRMRTIREEYKNVCKPLSDNEVVTKLAELVLLTGISGLNHVEDWLTSTNIIVRS